MSDHDALTGQPLTEQAQGDIAAYEAELERLYAQLHAADAAVAGLLSALAAEIDARPAGAYNHTARSYVLDAQIKGVVALRHDMVARIAAAEGEIRMLDGSAYL